MSNTPVTLQRLEFQNIVQFVEDLNQNFSVIQNSPLYKGILGKEGLTITGPKGTRGAKFLFVNLDKFISQFPNEITLSSEITQNFLNLKLSTFHNKQKLYTAFEIDDFVDKDIIVLTNTIMLSFDNLTNTLINTGIAFNPQSNLSTTIELKIEAAITKKIAENTILNNLNINVFKGIETFAKVLAQNSNLQIPSGSVIYSPYFPGINTTDKITDHKYWGLSNSEFPINNDGTIIFGSVAKYIELLEATINFDSNLTSDYAPNAINIPAVVILQNTDTSGILIGIKSSNNLKSFGNIYKSSDGFLNIKSDSGNIATEFSVLKLHATGLFYDKKLTLSDNLDVFKDLTVTGDITNKYIKTGKFAGDVIIRNGVLTREPNILYLGATDSDAKTKILSDSYFSKLTASKFLTLDSNKKTISTYYAENVALDTNALVGFNEITFFPNISSSGVVTTNYLAWLYSKLNSITSKIKSDYWTKDEFDGSDGNSPILPIIWLQNQLIVGFVNDGDGNDINPIFEINAEHDYINIGKDASTSINTHFLSKVLVTNSSGKILNTYSVETNAVPVSTIGLEAISHTFGTGDYSKNIITSNQIKFIYDKLNLIINSLNTSFVSPIIRASESFYVGATEDVRKLFEVKQNGNVINFLRDEDSAINFKDKFNKVLITDSSGNLEYNYEVAVNDDVTPDAPLVVIPDTYSSVPESTLELNTLIPETDSFTNKYLIKTNESNKFLIKFVNYVKSRFLNTFNKAEIGSRMIAEFSLVIDKSDPLNIFSFPSFYINNGIFSVASVKVRNSGNVSYRAEYEISITFLNKNDTSISKCSHIMTRNSNYTADRTDNDSVWTPGISIATTTGARMVKIYFIFDGKNVIGTDILYFKIFDISSFAEISANVANI